MFPGTHARRTPDKPAAVMAGSGESLTYRQLEENSARLARHLHGLGLRRGDTLAMLSDNQLQAYEIYWAAMRSGLYLTAVNHNLAPGEAAYIVNDSSAEALIVSGSKRELAEAMAADSPAVSHRLSFGGPVAGSAATRTRWPRRPPRRCPTSRAAPTCCTPPGPPGGPRGSRRRCRTGRWTSPATPT